MQYLLQNPLAGINWFMAGTGEKRTKLHNIDGVTFPGKVYSQEIWEVRKSCSSFHCRKWEEMELLAVEGAATGHRRLSQHSSTSHPSTRTDNPSH